MKKFEKEINFESIDIERAAKKAEKTMKGYEIKPDDFINTPEYSKEIIKKDNEYVARMETKFKKEQENHEGHKLAKILEAIFYEHAELSEWLGSNVETIKTSRFDDIVNGIDVIAEFSGNQETSHLGLAIDATLSNVIEEKLERIKKEIDEGHLAEIKYFYSEELNIRQPKKNLPRVIICVEAKTIKELSELWMENKNKELGQHQIQYQILEEIILQLETFKNYVEQKGFSNLAEIYEKDLEIVKNIYQEKKASDNYERDSMFELLKSSLKDFKDLKV